jgi:ferredoxin-NADP reductase
MSEPSRPGQTLTLHVTERRIVAEGVVALTLAAPDGSALPSWTPGAHLDLILKPDPSPAQPVARQYSLCGDPGDRLNYRVAVLREDSGRGGSRFLHEKLVEGTPVEVRGPRNHFVLRRSPQYLFIAGGIGITPLLPMIAAADAAGARWRLVYGGRTANSMAFLDELGRYDARVTVLPEDVFGLLPLAELIEREPAHTLIYSCGPEPLLAAVTRACQGRPDDSLVVERFQAGPPAADAPVREAARPFDVELAGSGRVLTVPAQSSLLDTLQTAGVAVLSSCHEGTCGTCEIGVLAGQVDHHDRLLTPAERAAHDTMFPCVSRALGDRLVLDL